MSDELFVSYKRQDEARVARLVQALEGAGLSVWWDRGLPGGESWRANIEAALESAKVVIVCWTHASVGPEGGFVRDEAARAGGRLVPVVLERGVRPPLGFGEVQAIDLSHWGGNANDPFFKDLVALVFAKRDGAPAPKPRGPATRALRRFVFGGGLTAATLAVLAFAWSTPVVRETTCAAPVPGLARTCCEAGFTEKLEVRDTAWTPVARDVAPLYLSDRVPPSPTEEAARADAQRRLIDDARFSCAPADPAFQRLASATPHSTRYTCRMEREGWRCSVDYAATCAIEEQRLVRRCPD
jgi:hypothetical protein